MAGGMSGPRPPRRGRRMAEAAAPAISSTATPDARPITMAPPADSPRSGISWPAPGPSRPAHAERSLRGLVDRVGAPGRAQDLVRRVHGHHAALEGDLE